MLAGDQCAHLVVHLMEAEKARIPASREYLDHLLKGVLAAAERVAAFPNLGLLK